MNAWLQLLRFSNMPTVWTNVGAGVAIGIFIAPKEPFTIAMTTAVGLTLLAATCLYAGGMILNDVFDLATDRIERPERPLPSGRISPRAAALVGWTLLGAGVVAAAIASRGDVWLPAIAATIAFLVVIYDRFHLSTAWSVLPMGLCRGLLYVLGAFAIPREIDTSGALILGLIALAALIHTIALSLIARDECHVLISACPECAYPVEEETSICPECGALATEQAITAQNTQSHQAKNIFFALGIFALAGPSALALLALLLTLGTDVSGGAWPLTGVAVAFLFLVWWLVGCHRQLFTSPPNIQGFVLGAIAAFCLYDASILILLPSYGWAPALVALVFFLIVRSAHRRIPGT